MCQCVRVYVVPLVSTGNLNVLRLLGINTVFFFFIMIIQKKSPAESFVNLKTKRYKESNSFLVKFCRETIALENRSTPNRVRIRLK